LTCHFLNAPQRLAKYRADLQNPKTSKPTALAKTLFCDLNLVQKIVETKFWWI